MERAAWDPQTEPTAPSDVGGARPTLVNKVSVTTLCASKTEFISKFGPFLDETTIFFASRLPLVIGQVVAFAICLKDRTPMLEGDGKIIEVQPMAGKAGRCGLRVEVRAFSAQSVPMRQAILAAKGARRTPGRPAAPAAPAAPAPPVPRVAPPVASPPRPVRAPAPAAPPSLAVKAAPPSPRAPAPKSNVLPLVPPDERRPGAPDTLPANPFADVSAQTLSVYVESNLAGGAEAHDVELPASGDDDLDSPAIHRNFIVRALSWRAPATLSPAVRIVLPMAASSLLTLVACWALWGHAPHPVAHTRGPVTAAAPAPAPVSAPAPARAPAPMPAAAPVPVAPVAPSVASAPAPEPVEPPSTSGCLVRIASRPAGATVTLGNRHLGKTPLHAAAIPCGRQILTVSHARYSSTDEAVAPAPGKTASSFVRLERPPARLILTSVPAGATFKVNRHSLGASPGQASVLRYERVRLEASLPGYHSWKKTIYVAAPEMKVNATLVPSASRSSRR